MEKKVLDAIIMQKSENTEVRCRNCGKLLFKIENNENFSVDKEQPYVIIVSRCTRNSCKQDNRVFLNASVGN